MNPNPQAPPTPDDEAALLEIRRQEHARVWRQAEARLRDALRLPDDLAQERRFDELLELGLQRQAESLAADWQARLEADAAAWQSRLNEAEAARLAAEQARTDAETRADEDLRRRAVADALRRAVESLQPAAERLDVALTAARALLEADYTLTVDEDGALALTPRKAPQPGDAPPDAPAILRERMKAAGMLRRRAPAPAPATRPVIIGPADRYAMQGLRAADDNLRRLRGDERAC